MKVLPSEECTTHRKALVCDIKIRKVKDTRRKFLPRRKIWKLHEDSVKSDFRSYINKYRASSPKDASVEAKWNALKRALLVATDKSFGSKKGPVDIKKHCGRMMMRVIKLVRSINYGRSGNRETQLRRNF